MERETAEESKTQTKEEEKVGIESIYDLKKTTLSQSIIRQQKINYPKCIESIQFSSFNPVPADRRQQGDLFYITVKTLDVGERGITACVNGFYVNNNVEGSTFNPSPSTKKGA